MDIYNSRRNYAQRELKLSIYLFLIFLSLTVKAANIPRTVEPGLIERQFQEHKEPRQTQEVIIKPRVEPEIEESDIRFILSNVIMKGNTVYSSEKLSALYKEFLNKEISLGDAYRIASLITARYRNDGYILSQAIIPAQKIQNGNLQIQILEGFIDKVSIEGNLSTNKERLLKNIAEKIRKSKPLNVKDLERYILLAGDLPGISAQANLAASASVLGASDLVLFVSEDSFDGFGSIDNRSSELIGPYQVQVGFNVNSLLGMHERTGVRTVTSAQTSELQFYEVSHEQTLNSELTKVLLVAQYTDSEPGDSLRTLEFESESINGEATISHPFIRSRAKNLFGRFSFNYRNSDTSVLGTALNRDRIRSVRTGISYDFVDSLHGINLFDFEISKGIKVLSASSSLASNLSRSDGETDYAKAIIEISRLQRLAPDYSLLLNITGQYTADGMVASEEFSIGGSLFGRAFDPSEVSGDRGYAAKVELRHYRNVPDFFLPQMQFYAFYDYGYVWNKTASNASFNRHEELSSTGAGIRTNIYNNVTANVEIAVPLIENLNVASSNKGEVRGFFEIGVQF